MSKFNQLLLEHGKAHLLTEEDFNAAAPAPVPTQSAIDTAKEAAPAPGGNAEGNLTSEGKRYLIGLAVKALGVDSKTLTEQEKAIFNTEVTAENAEDTLQRLQQIIEQHS